MNARRSTEKPTISETTNTKLEDDISVDEKLRIVDSEIRSFCEYCESVGLSSDELYSLTLPIFDFVFREKMKAAAKSVTIIVAFLGFLFALFTLTPVQHILGVYARHLAIKILPFWDWTTLYYRDCIIYNPFFERTRLLPEDCEVCESVDFIQHLSNASHYEISVDFLKNDIPVIVVDGMDDWPVITEPFSIENLTKMFLENDILNRCDPCSFSTNLRIRGQDSFKGFLHKIHSGEAKRWYGHWENCNKKASKALRHLYKRPYFLPPMVDTAEPSWIFASSQFKSRVYKHVPVLSELFWYAQVKGLTHIRLVPKSPCESVCPQLTDVLQEGEILLFTDLMWEFEYMPDEDEDNIAFAVGGFGET